MTIDRWLGIDVSQAVLDAHLLPSGEVWSVSNDADGIEGLVVRLKATRDVLVVMEATGGYQHEAAVALVTSTSSRHRALCHSIVR